MMARQSGKALLTWASSGQNVIMNKQEHSTIRRLNSRGRSMI